MRKEGKLALAFGLALIMGMTGCAGNETVHEDALEEAEIQESEWERSQSLPAGKSRRMKCSRSK